MMTEITKTVAVIGCGVTGLTAVKCCLDEGLQPTCFERSGTIGGLWAYIDNVEDNMTASIYRSTFTNTSKETMSYSDFPMPKEWPNFLHNSYVKKYCEMYAERFGLGRHVRLSTRVVRLDQADDFEVSGRWLVTYQHAGSSETVGVVFDSVMICTGMFNNPQTPKYPGIDDFQGKIIHSHDYRTPERYSNQRVVVVGVGNSAADVACDITGIASQVFLSARRGAWICGRRGNDGYPFFVTMARKYRLLPMSVYMKFLKRGLRQRYGLVSKPLEPAHDFLACEPLFSEQICGCILNGLIAVKPNIARFTKTGIEFQDGSQEDRIDAVVMATGYQFTFPFEVGCTALQPQKDKVPLYKLVFPLGLKHNTLSVNGAIAPLGPVIPCVELQARWAARVFKSLAVLPSQASMEKEVNETDKMMAQLFLGCHRYVDPISYREFMASEIGANPGSLTMLLTDPALAVRCLFGPYLPYHHRLVGPGKWDGARRAIMTVWDRIMEPNKTRWRVGEMGKIREKKKYSGRLPILLTVVVGILLGLAKAYWV